MKNILVLLAIVSTIYSCQNMDGFLYNTEEIEEYALPGNTIHESLIEPIELISDGNKIYGFNVKAKEKSNLNILYFHGNKHGIDEYWDRVMIYHEMNMNVFIFDYRGFGKSEDESSEKGLKEDSKAAIEYYTSTLTSEDTLIFYGYSLGCYPAIYSAVYLHQPYKLVIEAPFASANSITQSAMGLDIPQGWITDGKYDNATNIKSITSPLLLFHGTTDDYLPYKENGKVIYENAPKPKTQILVEDALHDDVPYALGVEEYKSRLIKWIRNQE